MAKFIGEYSAKLDDKGRLVFPAALKALADQEGSMRFIIKKDLFFPCLEMYAYEEWEKQSDALRSGLDLVLNRKHIQFWRAYMSNRDVVSPDEKNGRIMISRKLLNMIGVDKEVVFVGNDYKIEIWSKEQYPSSLLSEDDYVALAEEIRS